MVTVRVLLVDDDALVRAGLRLTLSSADDLEVVGEADDGAGAVRAVQKHRPDVVLMDIRMPQMDGITATLALRRLHAPPQVIVLTTLHAERRCWTRCAREPADSSSRTPRRARSSTLSGWSPPATPSFPVGDPHLAHPLGDPDASARHRAATQRLATLTERELEVATAIGTGASNADVAASLYMSEATV